MTTTETLETLELSYTNEQGNVKVEREYINHGTFVRMVDVEKMYNYQTEQWENVHRHTHDYALCDDSKTLKGDGSNWKGTGRNWREHFKDRHETRIRLRFPYDFQ